MDKFEEFIKLINPYLNYILFGILVLSLITIISLFIVYKVKMKKLKEFEKKEYERQIIENNNKQQIVENHKNNSHYKIKGDKECL